MLTKRGGWPYGHPPNCQFEVNTQSPQARGLVAWWPFLGNQGAITPLRDRVGAYDLTHYNSPTWTATAERGWVLLFDDAGNEYLSVVDTPITGTPLSLSCWFNNDNDGSHQVAMAMTDAGTDNFFTLQLRAGGTTALRCYANATQSAETTAGGALNEWHHACAIFSDDNNRSIYINGGFEGTDTGVATPANIDRIFIARLGSGYMSGMVSDCRIYNRALSDAEVWDHYQNRWELYRPVRRLWPVSGAICDTITVTVTSTITITIPVAVTVQE